MRVTKQINNSHLLIELGQLKSYIEELEYENGILVNKVNELEESRLKWIKVHHYNKKRKYANTGAKKGVHQTT